VIASAARRRTGGAAATAALALALALAAPSCRDRGRPAAAPAAGAAAATPSSSSAEARRAFYYWRTTFHLSPAERRALGDLGIERLYVRVMDVDWDDDAGAPRPRSPLAVDHGHAPQDDGASVPAGVDVVPVVFLRQRLLQHIGPGDPALAALADHIAGAVDGALARLAGPSRGAPALRELQIDCDWTDATRASYFALLGRIDAAARRRGAALSATIRLHQIKYRERTGVPPVARGMLMFYNMGAVDADPDAQAIFDAERARAYLPRLGDYPLPLDVALPIWSWVVHVRGDHVEGLLQDTDPGRLDGERFLRRAGARRFEVTDTSFIDGALVRRGDFLDVEETSDATTAAAAALVAGRLAPGPGRRTIALFHLSEKDLAHHDPGNLARAFGLLH
jgi:hypothetical protein